MRIKAITLLAAFAIHQGTVAQYMIDLSGEKLDVPGCTFTVDSVVLTFGTNDGIGTVMRGMMNERKSAFIQGGAQLGFQELAARSHVSAPTDRHVILQIDEVSISEFSGGMSESSICSMRCELLERDGIGWKLLYDVGDRLLNKGSMDATHKHAGNIATVLSHCLQRFQKRLSEGAIVPQPIAPEQVGKALPVRRIGAGFQDTKVPARGLLWSYMDLRENTPDSTAHFELRETLRSTPTVGAYKLKDLDDRDVKTAWGFSDGSNCYINTGGEFLQLIADTAGLYTYWDPPAEYDQNDFAAQMAFGLIGLAISRAGKSDIPRRFDLDAATGGLKLHHTPGGGTKNGAPHTILYSKNSKEDVPLCLHLSDGRIVRLNRGQYHVLRLKPSLDIYQVNCAICEGTSYAELSIDASRKSEDVILINVKKGVIQSDHPPTSVASSLLNDLDPAKEVK